MNDVRKHTLLLLACIPFLYECNPSGQKAPVLEYETVFEEMLETQKGNPASGSCPGN